MSNPELSAAPFGAQLRGKYTHFCLWAPARAAVTLEISGAAAQVMRRDEHGFFYAEASCGAGTRYRYRIDAELVVPDPASRRQAGDVHDSSIVADPDAYVWRCTDWRGRPWREMVIYELHAGCCGGFRGIERRLPDLVELGITALELMPIADFSGRRGWGYDGVLPFAPDTAYGSPDDLKHLIDTAHGMGICVYLDVVYNHFGPDGNYLHTYAPQFFTEQDSAWGAAIDFSKPQVREFFSQNVCYWLQEFRFDGLRFDAVHALADRSWLDEVAARVRQQIYPDRHVHLILENERNEAGYLERGFDAQWNDDGHNVLHVLLTGERHSYYQNYADQPIQKLARMLSEGFIYQGEPSPSHGGAPRGTPSKHLPPHAFVLFLQNHDQIGNRAGGERLIHLTDRDMLRAAVALQLLSPQIPLLFMGEEWGERAPFLFFTDFPEPLAEAVRAGRRREFAASPAGAVNSGSSVVADPNAETTFLQSIPDFAAAHSVEHREWWRYYRQLLRLRREYIVPGLQGAYSLGAQVVGRAALIANWQLDTGARLRIAINLSKAEVEIKQPAVKANGISVNNNVESSAAGRLLFESCPGAAVRAEHGVLLGYAAVIWIDAYAVASAL